MADFTTLGMISFIYGLLCIVIGLMKPPMIFKMKKFEVMKDIFKGERNVQIFVLVWGAIFIALPFIFS